MALALLAQQQSRHSRGGGAAKDGQARKPEQELGAVGAVQYAAWGGVGNGGWGGKNGV